MWLLSLHMVKIKNIWFLILTLLCVQKETHNTNLWLWVLQKIWGYVNLFIRAVPLNHRSYINEHTKKLEAYTFVAKCSTWHNIPTRIHTNLQHFIWKINSEDTSGHSLQSIKVKERGMTFRQYDGGKPSGWLPWRMVCMAFEAEDLGPTLWDQCSSWNCLVTWCLR